MPLGLLLVALALLTVAVWPACTERQRRLRAAVLDGLTGDDWPR